MIFSDERFNFSSTGRVLSQLMITIEADICRIIAKEDPPSTDPTGSNTPPSNDPPTRPPQPSRPPGPPGPPTRPPRWG